MLAWLGYFTDVSLALCLHAEPHAYTLNAFEHACSCFLPAASFCSPSIPGLLFQTVSSFALIEHTHPHQKQTEDSASRSWLLGAGKFKMEAVRQTLSAEENLVLADSLLKVLCASLSHLHLSHRKSSILF